MHGEPDGLPFGLAAANGMMLRQEGAVMQTRGPRAPLSRQPWTRIGGAIATVALLGLAAGCSHAAASPPHHSGSSPAGTAAEQCGHTKSAAGVPVDVEVVHGDATCGSALTVERAYAQAIRSGLAPGNGGGGPVKVRGWTCQGFPTPVVLKTGNASKCVQGSNEILAILVTPST
jgi:hypothetical protein